MAPPDVLGGFFLAIGSNSSFSAAFVREGFEAAGIRNEDFSTPAASLIFPGSDAPSVYGHGHGSGRASELIG